jgi:hypothetical protein
MITQDDFDNFIALLRAKGRANWIVLELLDQFLTAEVAFHQRHDLIHEPNRLSLLEIFETRAAFEDQRIGEKFVFGYDQLLPALRQSEFDYIGVSSITSEKGSYIFFSDRDMTDLIGALKSMRTLSQIGIRDHTHKEAIEKSGKKAGYVLDKYEVMVRNGKLVQ